MPNRKKLLLVIIALIGGALIGFALWSVLARDNATTPPAASELPAPDMAPADIAKLPAAKTFWGYLAQAQQQQRVSLTKQAEVSFTGDNTFTDKSFTKSHFDYQTKRFTYAQDNLTGLGRGKIRCNNDQQSALPAGYTEWQTQNSIDPTGYCMPQLVNLYIADGFNPAGLTKAQSDAFIAALQEKKGLVTVQSVAVTKHDGQTYLTYEAELHSIGFTDPRDGKVYYDGSSYLDTAFRKTGLDAVTHPYVHAGASRDGMRLTYVIDPTTQLPVYSQISPVAGREQGGAQGTLKINYRYRTMYEFGKPAFDLEAAKTTDLTFSW